MLFFKERPGKLEKGYSQDLVKRTVGVGIELVCILFVTITRVRGQDIIAALGLLLFVWRPSFQSHLPSR